MGRSLNNFDFSAYLQGYTKVSSHWVIEELIGGAANFTVRVRNPLWSNRSEVGGRSGEDEKNNLLAVLQGHDSVVMKQAPAYLAKSPEMPFSPYRQVCRFPALRRKPEPTHNTDVPRLLKQKHCASCMYLATDSPAHKEEYSNVTPGSRFLSFYSMTFGIMFSCRVI